MMKFFIHTISEESNGYVCVWTFYVGDDEEEIAMWEEQLVLPAASSYSTSLPEEQSGTPDHVPAEGSESSQIDLIPHASTYTVDMTGEITRLSSSEDDKQNSKASIMERARKRHAANLQKRFSLLSPRAQDKQNARASIMERARKRHSAKLQKTNSFVFRPKAQDEKSSRKLLSPSLLRRLKIQKSMGSALSPLPDIRI